MAVELELESTNGNFAFTGAGREWLDVEEGQGMEPGDPSFTEKVFARSLLKYGASLALESLKEKELVFPLKLHAATKALLAILIQEINIIARTEGAVVRWKDEGATQSTYFTLISGQLDDEFDFRLGQNNWLKCKLRLFTQPLGYYSKNGARALMLSGMATMSKVGTMPIITFPAASALAGDAPALMQAQLVGASIARSRYGAVSVLPGTKYVPFLPAPTLTLFAASSTFVHDVNAPGGTALHYSHLLPGFGPDIIWTTASEEEGFEYVGEQRVLVVARTPSGAVPIPIQTVSLFNFANKVGVSATPVATSAWLIYDVGVLAVASQQVNAGFGYHIQIGPAANAGASSAIDVAAVIQLPDALTCWVNTPSIAAEGEAESRMTFDGIANAIRYGGRIGIPASGVAPSSYADILDVSAYARGAIPPIYPKATAPIVAMLAANIAGNMNSTITILNINVLERTRYVF